MSNAATTTEEAIAANPGATAIGDPNVWQLICKFSAPAFMRSTKAMETPGGVVLQVSMIGYATDGTITACSEALTFLPGMGLIANEDGKTWRMVTHSAASYERYRTLPIAR